MPRFPSSLLGALLAASLGGCMVPASKYDTAQSRLHTEQSAHRQTMQRLHSTQAELEAARQQLSQAQQEAQGQAERLEALDRTLAQARLDASVVSDERKQAAELVEQLRGELERVGEHLREFAHDKSELSEALAAAQRRLERLGELERSVQFRALVARDLALALHEPLTTGEYELSVEDGSVVLRVPAARIYAPDGEALHPEAVQLCRVLVEATREHGESYIALTESGGTDQSDEQLMLRLKRVSDGLVAEGLAETSVTITVPGPQAPTASASAEGAADPAPPTSDPPVVLFSIASV